MVGPLGRIIAQGVLLGVSILSRALPAAYAQAIQNARKNGVQAAARTVKKGQMSVDEAADILNLQQKIGTVSKIDLEEVRGQFEKYHAANAVDKGGSFYLQSKVYRAKELLEEHAREKEKENEEKKNENA
uniref:Presequence translocated-associated motor subunit PAM16 n=1 Tax=Corethron hystrix TaxID=216773 RepID=A0A6U5HF93_9STRA|mmetsp:Transcript_30178/g.69185  ORF Transcript_30178/g.69185 Transcript_30178/m.69185 type:complete len:130 (+) Transcript_30178:118-507(+)|eukprot:CAMPEP_0113309630 /NCGR_PEP_ID=MMETSP0010_2-20120614/7593_1 /TAXON_ID=216773 ORGANISM="Corethron hystrix, Strain 308" /NCGR_SAMPLE_ID=MMETSP0010_2 /ASSEMBLY_ACC=CAM_ASM_000155 /LENGTH=129 /DNA_ID=CAMNT_0000164913 /DNA_START=222 /DNA_END=611 /DNA_ORIENTATION=- /assembly_acc=CAM_ASM_000155